MTGLVELIGCSQTGRSRTNNGSTFTGSEFRGSRLNPALFVSIFNDRHFNSLDGDRRLIDAECACTFAWRRTNSAGKFGKIVCLQQLLHRLIPIVLMDEIVPARNNIAKRTAMRGLTERNTTIHTARRLNSDILSDILKVINFAPLIDALLNITEISLDAFILHETTA